MPLLTFNAVRTPGRDMPNSTNVIATAGRMPTSTVSASNMRAIAGDIAIIRPMKESTTSRDDISIKTPARAILDDAVGQIFL